MALFIYKARDSQGLLIEGEMEMDNPSLVRRALADKGLFPTAVGQKGVSIKLPKFLQRAGRVKVKDLIAMTRQMSVLFKAGVPINRIFATLIKQSSNPALKRALEGIHKDITSGSSLADAFAKYPKIFGELYVSMIAAGEQAGLLEMTLKEIIKILQNEHRITTSVKSATLYPKIVLVAFVCVSVLMITFVIPRFADFYGGYGAQLPLPTRIMIGISDVFQTYWYFAFIAITVAIVLFQRYKKTKIGRLSVDRLKFKLPVFGRLNLMVANARFSRLVSALYKSGMPLSSTLNIAGNTIDNTAYQKEVVTINEDVKKGSSLAGAMEKRKYFTPLVVEATAVGEQSGALDELLNTTAEFYDDEVSVMLDQLTTLIEPLLLVGLFSMVALLAFAIFLPMWNVSKVILTH